MMWYACEMLQSVSVCVGTWGILCGAFGYDEARSHENLLIKIFQTSIHSTVRPSIRNVYRLTRHFAIAA